MVGGMPALTHEQQQAAAERIQTLMTQGMSSGEAIAQVAAEIRASHRGEQIRVAFDETDDDDEASQ
ncbi:MAG: YoaH family protein [Edwardsiella sp. (in: enterobacteria)]|uniref:YoaH family protein n=1 Tax=Edwardsiella piscicida TaxID=1263550 RepID=UPI00054CBE28|nr:YoaH family protein [Edwardsiella piscicida]